ncbi:MAG: 2-oxo acid dehydrogenase subunit E2 [Candidatus Aminicenantes bacterium]|nr:2-oxo acid dehydrogenase subunit E2 [Candidatus Aminicenantes bacterium]
MAKQFKFPDVGEGITEGEIVRWLIKEGDEVKEDQTLAEVETDKAVVEMPSPYAGTILKIHAGVKDIIKVGQVLVTIGGKGEAVGEAAAEMKTEGKAAPVTGPSVVGVVTDSKEEIREVLATPKVRKLSLELGVDIKAVKGTGPQGRITEDDIKAAKAALAAPKEEKKPAFKIKEKYDFYGELERIPLRGVRRATAKRMHESVSTAAHVTHFDEADVTELMKIREGLKAQAAEKGVKLTYLPFIVKAVLAAIKAHPLLNATLNDEDEEIIVKKYYNFGIAVDVPDGLIVPVVKGVDQKSIFDLAGEIQAVAEAAKKRSLNLADLKGGTFSITNVGGIGGEAATPIINYPEVAILATLKIKDRVRVKNGEVKAMRTLPLCLSFDHRVIDGAEAARFMNDLVAKLEDADFLGRAAGGKE